jgi:hypothetical protein
MLVVHRLDQSGIVGGGVRLFLDERADVVILPGMSLASRLGKALLLPGAQVGKGLRLVFGEEQADQIADPVLEYFARQRILPRERFVVFD